MEAQKPEPRRPHIVVSNTTASQIMPAVLDILITQQAQAPRLFTQRGGILVRLRDGGRGEVEFLTPDRLHTELDRAIEFRRLRADGYDRTSPPTALVKSLLTSDRFADLPELPELRRVMDVPFFTETGELVITHGYHAGARTFLRMPLALQGMAPLPDQPSRTEVEQAKRLLLRELLVDFPFAAPSSLAHALALIITPFVRELIGLNNLIPMVAVAAPVMGSGKTKLASVASYISTGEPAPTMPADFQREELEKRITPLLISGAPYCVLDNAADLIDSPALAALLTGNTWRGRILGKSEIVTLPNHTQWIVTGNNLRFTDEMARRALTIALDPKRPDPNKRTGFKHDPLESWIKTERAQLVRATLTLVQHWLASGKPEFTARVLGSYEQYSRVVGGILQAAGLDEGFLTSTQVDLDFVLSPTKDGDADLARLVTAWSISYVGYDLTDAATLADVAPSDLFSDSKDRAIALGMFVKKNAGRTIAGHRIICERVKVEGRERNRFRLVDATRE